MRFLAEGYAVWEKTLLFSGFFGFYDADTEETGGICGAKDAGVGGGPVDHVSTGFEGDLAVAATVVGDDNRLSGNLLSIAGAFDGEGGKRGVGGGKVGEPDGGGTGYNGEIGLFGVVGINADEDAADFDVEVGVIAEVVDGGEVALGQGDGFAGEGGLAAAAAAVVGNEGGEFGGEGREGKAGEESDEGEFERGHDD